MERSTEAANGDIAESVPMREACCALCGRAVSRLTRHHLVPRTLHKRVRTRRNFTRAERHAVILLCGPCHKQIHVMFTKSELARDYASIEAIAAHPEIARFVRWVVRQPPTTDIPVRAPRLEKR